MIYLFMTPQANNASPMNGEKISIGILETIAALDHREKDVCTYNALVLNKDFKHTDGELFVVLCNGDLIIPDKMSLKDLLVKEKNAYDSIKNINPKDLPQTEPIKKQIITSALSYYQGLYMDNHEEEMQEAVTDSIIKARTEATKKIRTELDLIAKMAETYNLGTIDSFMINNGVTMIVINDEKGLEELVTKGLSRVVRDGDLSPVECSISTLGQYTINFSSGKSIVRAIIDGKEDYSINDIEK